jgi:hypothetical protein
LNSLLIIVPPVTAYLPRSRKTLVASKFFMYEFRLASYIGILSLGLTYLFLLVQVLQPESKIVVYMDLVSRRRLKFVVDVPYLS